MTKKILFGGKGGVGKTTIAAATALYLAGFGKTLIVSTDPAHSLSDIFEMEVGSEATPVAVNLFAIEIDPQKSIQAYKQKVMQQYRETLQEFDLEIESYLETMEQSPGAYESAIFDEFAGHLLRTDYDNIVFDTAPTGSTLRLIFMPEYLQGWIRFLIRSRQGILKLKDMLIREKDPVIETLYQMQDQFQRVATILKSKSADIILVMNPETLAWQETSRTIKTLNRYQVPVKALVVNRVVGDEFPYKGYLRTQRRILDQLQRHFSTIEKIEVPFLGEEVRGVESLSQLRAYVEKLFA